MKTGTWGTKVFWCLELGIWSLAPVSLPEFIEIVPLQKPVQAEIAVPGSKSITNRALVLAALSEGVTTLRGALWSEEEIKAMADYLGKVYSK